MKAFKINKKAEIFGELAKIGTALLVVGIILTVGFLIIDQVQTNMLTIESCGNEPYCRNTSIAYNSSVKVNEGMEDVTDWLSIVVITIIGAVLLGLIFMFGRGIIQKR